MTSCSYICVGTTAPKKVIGTTAKEIFVPRVIVGTVVPTMIVGTAVPTRVVGTTAREMIVPPMTVGTVVPTMIVGTAVPTIIVLTAYYWKSCHLQDHYNASKGPIGGLIFRFPTT